MVFGEITIVPRPFSRIRGGPIDAGGRVSPGMKSGQCLPPRARCELRAESAPPVRSPAIRAGGSWLPAGRHRYSRDGIRIPRCPPESSERSPGTAFRRARRSLRCRACHPGRRSLADRLLREIYSRSGARFELLRNASKGWAGQEDGAIATAAEVRKDCAALGHRRHALLAREDSTHWGTSVCACACRRGRLEFPLLEFFGFAPWPRLRSLPRSDGPQLPVQQRSS